MRVRLLRAMTIRIGRTSIRPSSHVQFALAMYLAATGGQSVSRARLLELFYPDASLTDARHALRQMLYRLRRAGLEFSESHESLLVDPAKIDADFLTALTPEWAHSASVEELTAATRFLADVAMLSTPHFEEWLDGLRAQVAAAARRALLTCLAATRREGRWAELDALAQLLLTIDPLNEEATLSRAEALAMVGAKAEAMRILDTFVEEVDGRSQDISLPAKVLRRRISDAVVTHPHAGVALRPFIGRQQELGQLQDAMDRAAARAGTVVSMSGASGMGKSRLAAQANAVAGLRGFRRVEVRLSQQDATRSLALFSELVPLIVASPGGAACSPDSMSVLLAFTQPEDSAAAARRATERAMSRSLVRRSLIDVIEAVTDEAPLFVLVDDAHHLDPASTSLLVDVVGGTAHCRVVWLLCGTDWDDVRWRDLRALTTVRLPLSGLSRCDCDAFATSVLTHTLGAEESARLDECYGATNGNPLFVREWMLHYSVPGNAEAAPGRMRDTLLARARTLSDAGLHVLRACALLGAHATPESVRAVLDLSTPVLLSALEEIGKADLLSVEASTALTMHDVPAGIVTEDLSPAVRALLHYRIAEYLETRAAGVWIPRLAWDAARHFQDAGDPKRARVLLIRYGRHLMTLGAPAEAAETFALAVPLSVTTEDRLRVTVDYAHALYCAGSSRQVTVVVSEALGQYRREEALEDAACELELIGIEAAWGVGEDAHSNLDRTERLLRRPGISERVLGKAATLASGLAAELWDTETLNRIDNLVSARTSGTDSTVSSIHTAQGISLFQRGAFDDAASAFLRAIDIDSQSTDSISLITALHGHANVLRQVDRIDEGMRQLRRAFEVSSKLGLSVFASRIADRMSALHFDRYEVEEAHSWLGVAERWVRRSEHLTAQNSIAHQRQMLAVHFGSLPLSGAEASQPLPILIDDRVSSRRLANLALACHTAALEENGDLLALTVPHLLRAVGQASPTTLCDYALSALLSAARFTLDRSTCMEAVENRRTRRLPTNRDEKWYLVTAINEDWSTLYGRQ